MTCDPHFMRAYIGQQDIFRSQGFSDISKDFLWFDRKTHVIFVFTIFLHHHIFNLQGFPWFCTAAAAVGDIIQRIADISHYLDSCLVILVNMSRAAVDMNDGLVFSGVPLLGSILHQIVADSNDDIGFFQDFVLIILLRNADGPHGILAVKRNDTFCHHGMYHRNFQFFRKVCHSLRSLCTDSACSCENDRCFCLIKHACSKFNGIQIGKFLRLHFLWKGAFPCGNRHFSNIDRQVDVGGAGFFTFCIFKRKPHNFAHIFRLHDHLGTFGDGLKHLCKIQKLV